MTTHYVADGDRALVFDGPDARRRALRYTQLKGMEYPEYLRALKRIYAAKKVKRA